jgi:hypothetical protein
VVLRETRGFFETAHSALQWKRNPRAPRCKKNPGPTTFPSPRISRELRSHQASRLKLCVSGSHPVVKPSSIPETRQFHHGRFPYYYKNSRKASFGPAATQIPGSRGKISRLSSDGNLSISAWHSLPITSLLDPCTGIFRANSRYFPAKREFLAQTGST